MNRIGIGIALAIAVVVGGIFAVYPRLDLVLAALFFDPATKSFNIFGTEWVPHARDAATWIITLLVAPAFVALAGKLILPRRKPLISCRASILLIVTLALGPGALSNAVLKEHWGRSRPIDVTEFGGTDRFTPWWDPRGPCPSNCSFVGGEASGAFWTLAPAALAPPQWRLLAYGAALAFGSAVSVLRMMAGAHFFTDVVFAGVLMFVVVWIAHGVIYRWRATRLSEEAAERPLVWAGEALRSLGEGFGRYIRGGADKRL